MSARPVVAYFSMEIGLEPSIPTYAGGLGVLAGDTIRSAADLDVPMVAVTLLHRAGYFYQRIDEGGLQREEPVSWPIDDFLERLDTRVALEVRGRRVEVACWRYGVRGVSGGEVPVYLLDTDLPENDAADRRLTDVLYGGGEEYRLCQEVVLGLGGIALLRARGHEIARYHLNEGHAALIVLGLLDERLAAPVPAASITEEVIDAVRLHTGLQGLRLVRSGRAVESVQVEDHCPAPARSAASSFPWMPPKPPFDITTTWSPLRASSVISLTSSSTLEAARTWRPAARKISTGSQSKPLA